MRFFSKTLQTIIFSVLFFSIKNTATAQDKINVVTTAVPFLRISPDARAGGMGEVGIATTPDANSGFWNLAKTPFAKSQGSAAITYSPWLKKLGLNDVYLLTGSGYYKLDELQAVTGGIRYFSLGNIQFTDASGQSIGTFSPKEFSIDLGYSRKLSDKIGMGFALRYINSNLAGGAVSTNSGAVYKAGSAVAADLSFFYTAAKENGEGLSLGATLTNLGSKIGYTTDATQKDFIPANLGLGGAYTKVFDEQNKITFGMDINKLLVPTSSAAIRDGVATAQEVTDYRSKSVVSSWVSSLGDAPGGFSEELKEFQISVGAEYWYQEQFALRAGYFYEDKTKGDRRYLTLGAGFRYTTFGLNFSYLVPSGSGISQNPLSNTLRFSIIFDFDGKDGTAKTE